MAWNISGQMLETCTCQQVCPCNFGPANPDAGWCSGIILFDIQNGTSDGVELSGTKAVLAFDLPHDFAGGNATARMYFDDRASAKQRQELEAVFSGKKGGAFAALSGVISKALSTQFERIDVHNGDKATATIGKVGHLQLVKIKDEEGKQAKVENAPTTRAFANPMELAMGDGSYWVDPDLRKWSSGGAGSVSPFSMKS